MTEAKKQFDREEILYFDDLEAQFSASEPPLETLHASCLTRSEVLALFEDGRIFDYLDEIIHKPTDEEMAEAEDVARELSNQ